MGFADIAWRRRVTAVYCDTSALYALAVPGEDDHERAVHAWLKLVESDSRVMMTNYTFVECATLLQARRGVGVAAQFREIVEGIIEIAFVDERLHWQAFDNLVRSARRRVSLVDEVAFAFMRENQMRIAFAFDRDFADAGFTLL
jgi:uncharacterized protein